MVKSVGCVAQEKLQKRILSATVKQLNAPRPGKKCLVLDIDYTLFDMKSVAERPDELARPFLRHMLSTVYQHYDIVIWSATSMRWIEVRDYTSLHFENGVLQA